MRLIIEFTTGDGYTYWARETIPIVYESAEAFAVEFEEFCRKRLKDFNHDQFFDLTAVKFASRSWDICDFFEDGKYVAPDIMTVDEWFNLVENT